MLTIPFGIDDVFKKAVSFTSMLTLPFCWFSFPFRGQQPREGFLAPGIGIGAVLDIDVSDASIIRSALS
jgi:hypothetical protein